MLQERVDRLQDAAAHGTSLERLMLHDGILAASPNGTRHPGASTTYLVVFESRRQAIFKPFGGQQPNACANFGQDRFEVVLHEVTAWRLAHALGEPWEQLVPAAVLRHLDGIGPGALIDHGFAFAQPGDLLNDSLFLARRRSANASVLGERERVALEALLGEDLFGLPGFIAAERVDAIEQRARWMLERRLLPLPGEF